ncbi:hypothetical protein BDW72DRAFT_165457 [Aspergillus terricola var. indicus]
MPSLGLCFIATYIVIFAEFLYSRCDHSRAMTNDAYFAKPNFSLGLHVALPSPN